MKENKHSLRRGNLGGLIRTFLAKRRKEEEMVTETTRRRSRWFFFLSCPRSPCGVYFEVHALTLVPMFPGVYFFSLLQSSTFPASLALA